MRKRYYKKNDKLIYVNLMAYTMVLANLYLPLHRKHQVELEAQSIFRLGDTKLYI